MEWYWILLLAFVAMVAVLAGAFLLLRASSRGREFLSLSTSQKLRFVRILIGSADVPWVAKANVFLLTVYLAMPLDLLPDILPVVGQLDDAIMIALVIGIVIRLIPRRVFHAAIRQARGESAEPPGPAS